MKIKANMDKDHGGIIASLRCPHCGKEGTFNKMGPDRIINTQFVTGQRRCPDPECLGHVFVVFKLGVLIASYPPARIEFNSENIPEKILKTFEEALESHANKCYIASSILVRRTLEEICKERDAKGQNLKKRIEELKTKIILPEELFEAMNELRLLGNDAAHIEAEVYNEIGNTEVETAIELTKEILKALYQYSSLLERLRGLKNPPK